jgi:hypothetical protein
MDEVIDVVVPFLAETVVIPEVEAYSPWPGIFLLLGLAPIALAMYVAMLYIPLRLAGIRVKDALQDITLPEAVLFGLYSIGCANVVDTIFSRFV